MILAYDTQSLYFGGFYEHTYGKTASRQCQSLSRRQYFSQKLADCAFDLPRWRSDRRCRFYGYRRCWLDHSHRSYDIRYDCLLFSFARTGESKFETLFDGFKQDFVQTLLIGLMQTVFTFLWSLLFVIPGIVKSYSYSMAQYIKHDNPTWDWEQCITESRRIMDGNKWKLFCLQLSFIGWFFVSMLTCAIGNLWLIPYMSAANLSFYESIKNKA